MEKLARFNHFIKPASPRIMFNEKLHRCVPLSSFQSQELAEVGGLLAWIK